jgi:hypothetical protein
LPLQQGLNEKNITTEIGWLYYILALASLIAKYNNPALKGPVTPKITPVTKFPNSGTPEVNSNTEPTAAIAAIQEAANNKLDFKLPTILLPVIYFIDEKVTTF